MAKHTLIAASLFALALSSSVSEGLAQGGCLSGRQARQLLEQGLVVPLPQAIQQAGLSSGQVVDAKLCEAGGGYVYRVRVLQPGGKVRAVNIPAG